MTDPLQPLLDAFASLSPQLGSSNPGGKYNALPFPNREFHHIAVNSMGAPVILLKVSDGDHHLAPIQLAHLEVRHDILCRVTRPDGSTEQGYFSTIAFSGEDRSLYEYFLRVVGGSVLALSGKLTQHDIAFMVQRLAELFNALTRQPRQSAQGLWAELFVIARSYHIMPLLSAWRETPEALYDFSTTSQCIEVKSVIGEARRHHFSLNQLHPQMIEMCWLYRSCFNALRMA